MEPKLSIGNTSQMSIAELAEMTNRTFAGYKIPVKHTPEGFAMFCRTHSLDMAHSVTLLHEEEVIGLTMLGIRQDRAWCGGFGIVPEFRGQGNARLLIEGLIERSRSLGLRLLQLEVLSENQPALRTYQRAGLNIVRSLAVFMGNASELYERLEPNPLRPESVSIEEGFFRANRGSAAVWQREQTMVEQRQGLSAWSVEHGEDSGAIVYWYNSNDRLLRVERLAFNSVAAAQALLRKAIEECQKIQAGTKDEKPISLFVLNEPVDSPLYALLNQLDLPIIHRQEEMCILL